VVQGVVQESVKNCVPRSRLRTSAFTPGATGIRKRMLEYLFDGGLKP
jgi:hypothetical protein